MSRRICVELYERIVALRPEWHDDDPDAGPDQGRHDRLGGRPGRVPAAPPPRRRAAQAQGASEGPGRPARARHRPRHVAHRLRRAVAAHDVRRQADAGRRAHAGDRARQPHVPRQARRSHRRLHRHRPEPARGARRVLAVRPRAGGRADRRGRRGHAREARHRLRHPPPPRLVLGSDARRRGPDERAREHDELRAGRPRPQDALRRPGARARQGVRACRRARRGARDPRRRPVLRRHPRRDRQARHARAQAGRQPAGPAEIDTAIAQLVSEAVAADEVVDVYAQLGMERPDLSILSDEFLDGLADGRPARTCRWSC